MFCTTIIPTIGRSTLSRAINSVLRQEFTDANFEVIVVNDSGQELAETDWQKSNRVTVLHTNQYERCVARNTGAAIAKGKYLHFLDDDDWLLPGALQVFWDLAQNNNSDWLYGATQLVDRENKPLIQLKHRLEGNCFIQVMAGEWIPLQSSFIKADTFFSTGGFSPLILATEDNDLIRRLALNNDIDGTSDVVACVQMGQDNSSTDHLRASQYSHWAREKILDQPNVFQRMRASSNSSYWYGRIVRAYLTSVIWNLRHRRIFTGISRTFFGLTAFAIANRYMFSPDFWHGVIRSYQSKTFAEGFQSTKNDL